MSISLCETSNLPLDLHYYIRIEVMNHRSLVSISIVIQETTSHY